jgi:hypothetical protein
MNSKILNPLHSTFIIPAGHTLFPLSVATAVVLLTLCSTGCKRKTEAEKPWETMVVKPVADELEGTKFTVSIPDSLTRELNSIASLGVEYATPYNGAAGLTVSISVGELVMRMGKEADSMASLQDVAIVTRKELNESKIPDYLISGKSSDGSKAVAESYRRTGKKAIRCRAKLSGSRPLPNVDAKLQFLEKVCASILPAEPAAPLPNEPGAVSPSASPPSSAAQAELEALPAEVAMFMSKIGTHDSTESALKKFGGSQLNVDNMDIFDLVEPHIIRSRVVSGNTCYEIQAKTGLAKRSFDVCWKGKRITSVKNLGFAK